MVRIAAVCAAVVMLVHGASASGDTSHVANAEWLAQLGGPDTASAPDGSCS